MAYKFWEEMRGSLKRILTKNSTMSDESAELVINTLRRSASLDVISEFNLLKLSPDIKNRHYVAGYYDALEDLVRFVRKEI